METINWPQKTREYHNHHFDSTIWNDFNFRNDILEHCSFDYMKKNSVKSVPLGGAFWDGGSDTFITKGTNGRWKDIFSKEDSERYKKMCIENLGEACTHWLNTGNY